MLHIIGNLFLYLGLYRMIRTMFGTAYVGYQKGDTIVVSKKQKLYSIGLAFVFWYAVKL